MGTAVLLVALAQSNGWADAPQGADIPSREVSHEGILKSGTVSEPRVELSSPTVVDGGAVWITLQRPESRKSASVIGHFEGIELPFFADPTHCETCVAAVLGVPHGHKEGASEIFIELEGESKPLKVDLQIADAHYASEKLTVNPRKVNPLARDLPRIERDSHDVGVVYSRLTSEKLWSGAFVLPINSEITSHFGTKRMYNGELRNYHGGLDLKAAIGTKIHAANGGIVAMAKYLFYTGNTVILDHGYGIFTVYAHLSKVKVKLGQRVAKGATLGLSGKSGRVTGPHLHWQTVIHHIKTDPARVMQVLQ